MGNFSHLPTEILLDIITRLPTELILECKFVCRTWRHLVSHPSFSRLHLARINQSADSGKLRFLVFSEKSKQLYYFEYEDSIHSNRRFKFTPPFPSAIYSVIGYFNGLFCLSGLQDHCICNPVTKEYVMFTDYNRNVDDWCICHSRGFGYLPLTNEYKVVELFHKIKAEDYSVEVAVYTLGSGNGWRNLGRVDTKFGQVCKDYGIFVNGALHWVDTTGERVFVFDLNEEKFGEPVSLPLLPPGSTRCDFSIGDLGGVLYYAVEYDCLVAEHTLTDIWLLNEKNGIPDMKEQVEQEPLGWRKELSLYKKEPLAFTKSGGVLCFDSSSISIYDPIASTSEDLVDFGEIDQVFPHRNTLASLKEIGEEDVKVLESS